MKTSLRFFIRIILPAAALVASSACNFAQANAGQGTPQTNVVTSENQTGAADTQAQPPPDQGTAPTMTATLTPTLTSTLTATPTITPTATIASPTMTAGQVLSSVTGPHWVLYNWVTSIAKGETVILLAKASPEWEEYYYVRKADGKECWAFGGSSTKSGDLSTLQEKEAPPLPEVTYKVENKMFLGITDLYIREKDEVAWGADRLGAGNIIPGATFSLTFIAGFYDVMMRDGLGGVLYEKYDTPIGPEPSSSQIVLQNRYAMSVKNNKPVDICKVTIFSWVSGSVTLSIPGDGVITTGETVSLETVAGFYDFHAYRCGDLAAVFSTGGAYFGPLSGTLVIS
jgi:hypothetical protein